MNVDSERGTRFAFSSSSSSSSSTAATWSARTSHRTPRTRTRTGGRRRRCRSRCRALALNQDRRTVTADSRTHAPTLRLASLAEGPPQAGEPPSPPSPRPGACPPQAAGCSAPAFRRTTYVCIQYYEYTATLASALVHHPEPSLRRPRLRTAKSRNGVQSSPVQSEDPGGLGYWGTTTLHR